NSDTHTTSCTSYHFHCRLYGKCIQIWHLIFSDRLHLLPSNGSNLLTVRLARPTLDFGRVFQLNRYRRSLNDKIERFVGINSNDYRQYLSWFVLRTSVELFTEIHDIHTLRTQSRSYWRRWIRCTALHL